MSIRFCSNGSFQISYDGQTIQNSSQQGGSKKRYYIYDGHRYTKTHIHEGKKCIHCKAKKLYVPVKGLKGGTNTTEATCQKMPLPSEIANIIKSKVYQDNKNELKDVFAFYIATEKHSGNKSLLLQFLTNYIKEMLKDLGNDFIFSVSMLTEKDTFTENMDLTNIDTKCKILFAFLQKVDVLTFVECSLRKQVGELKSLKFYDDHQTPMSRKLEKYFQFVNKRKVLRQIQKYKEHLNTLKLKIGTTVKYLKTQNKYYSKNTRIQSRRLFEVLKKIYSELREEEEANSHMISSGKVFDNFIREAEESINYVLKLIDDYEYSESDEQAEQTYYELGDYILHGNFTW
jgi:hypothetical protein